jgi:hypothetical protein
MSSAAPVVTAHTGTNADLIAEVCRLYAPPGSLVADATWGQGRFWRKAPGGVTLIGSDLHPGPGARLLADFCQLPYQDGALDVVVLDPPYAHNAGTRHAARADRYQATGSRYNGHATTAGMYHRDIMALYRDGLAEAFRVLRPDGGTCWVKTKDEVEREVNRWAHIKVYEMALETGFCARDLFVLVPTAQQAQRWPGRVQHHARKTHSYLWIFQRPDERYARLLAQTPPGNGPRHVQARRRRVARMAAGGVSQRTIARKLGVSQSTIRSDMAWLRGRGGI